jgi:hypothetical protein
MAEPIYRLPRTDERSGRMCPRCTGPKTVQPNSAAPASSFGSAARTTGQRGPAPAVAARRRLAGSVAAAAAMLAASRSVSGGRSRRTTPGGRRERERAVKS